MDRDNDGKESLGHYEPPPLVSDREPIDWPGLAKGFFVALFAWIVLGACVFGFGYFCGTRF